VQRYINKIQRRDKQLIKAKEFAEEANKAKSQFLANMSHELRTPLNSILGYSEMISHQVMGNIENAKYLEYAGYINFSGKHLLSLVNDLLDISKAEAGHFSVDRAELNPCKMISEAMEIISHQASSNNVHIELIMPETMPVILVDEMRIKQVIINIMSNAIKFSHQGGKIEMHVNYNNADFYIIIRDYGIGISEDGIHKVLERFEQANQDMQKKKNEGSGLGMWLTKILVEAHNGKISIESALGKGTTVTVNIPMCMVHQQFQKAQ
jgi:signal transduction histidine kinase